MSKYESAHRALLEKITDGTYAVGQLLPSEHQLSQEYGISRQTLRKALALLTERGYIQKIMGKGSVVLHRPTYALPISQLVSYKELSAASGTQARTEVLSIGTASLPVSLFRELDPSLEPAECTQIRRLRFLGGQPAIVDEDWIVQSVVPQIPASAAQNSLYEHLEEDLGLRIGYSSKQITVVPATAEDQRLLGLRPADSVAVTTSVTSLENTTAFLFTVSRHRPDTFRYQDFARRRAAL